MGDESTRQQRLKEALQVTTNEAACTAVLEQLPDYIAAQLDGRDRADGRDPFALFPHIATHLDGCLHCAAAYGRLYRLALAEQTQALPTIQQPRQPDLSFLQPVPQPTALTALADKLRSTFEKLENGWRFQLSADLLPLLQPQTPPLLLRAPANEERYAELLLVLEPDEELLTELPLKLLVYRDFQVPTNCLVEVWVQPHGRTWPHLAGFTVTLQLPQHTHQQTTNPWGVASFEEIPINSLDTLLITLEL